jgi:hypothetical protein
MGCIDVSEEELSAAECENKQCEVPHEGKKEKF